MAEMKRIMSNLDEYYIKFEDVKITVILDNTGKLWYFDVDMEYVKSIIENEFGGLFKMQTNDDLQRAIRWK